MTQNRRLLYLPTLMALCILVGGSPLFAQLSPQLKEILEKRNFSEMIADYDQKKVTLKSPGRELRELAARPYEIGEGYRVQAFAGSSQENAKMVAADLRRLRMDSVYVITTPHYLYKVQIGNFEDRREAEKLLDQVKKAGFATAWIVTSAIHIPKDPALLAGNSHTVETTSMQGDTRVYYTIQIFATNNETKANQVRREFEQKSDLPAAVRNQNTIWKVLVGRFYEREAAESALKRLRQSQSSYADAWITQVASS